MIDSVAKIFDIQTVQNCWWCVHCWDHKKQYAQSSFIGRHDTCNLTVYSILIIFIVLWFDGNYCLGLEAFDHIKYPNNSLFYSLFDLWLCINRYEFVDASSFGWNHWQIMRFTFTIQFIIYDVLYLKLLGAIYLKKCFTPLCEKCSTHQW